MFRNFSFVFGSILTILFFDRYGFLCCKLLTCLFPIILNVLVFAPTATLILMVCSNLSVWNELISWWNILQPVPLFGLLIVAQTKTALWWFSFKEMSRHPKTVIIRPFWNYRWIILKLSRTLIYLWLIKRFISTFLAFSKLRYRRF